MLVAIAAAIIGAIVYRLDTATRPRRRALLPVYVPALLLTVPFGIFHAAQAGLIDLSPDTVARVGWGVTVGRGTLAYGFLLSIVLANMFAGRALKNAVGGREFRARKVNNILRHRATFDPPLVNSVWRPR